MAIINSPDDLTEQQRREIVEGFAILGRKLRGWRQYGGLHSLRAEILNADGTLSVTCHADDSVTMRDGDVVLDLGPVLDPHA